ncbi:MAG: DUF4338 domain-containing protein [Tannerella sp.]|nr:DUF4338 domain-containing protein [Tannerella sp.]
MIINTSALPDNDFLNTSYKNHTTTYVETKDIKETVVLSIIRDLTRLNWSVKHQDKKIIIEPPDVYDKDVIRHSMSIKRDEIIEKNRIWIDNHIEMARNNLSDGSDVLKSEIAPVIEICSTQKQHDLFRLFRYYWSSPYSEYVGRRIKIIIRDYALPARPAIGIAALGSPIIHIPERDNYIGWNKSERTKRINYMMDAYVIGALPPYNYLLGGKLVSYLLTSKEIRKIYKKKYQDSNYSEIAGIFTTSLYGKSSQYNRLKMNGREIYIPIGETKGYGTLHLTNKTIELMIKFLKENNIIVSNVFGDGPSWTMRVIRTAGELLGFDTDQLLMHSFKRNIYFVPFAKNTKEFLIGKNKTLKFYSHNVEFLTNYWKQRWYNQRKEDHKIIVNVSQFKKDDFIL